MRKFILAASLAALALPLAPVAADPPPWAHGRGRGNWHQDRGWYADRHYRDARRYNYRERRLGRNDRIYRGHDGRFYCRRNDGSTGLILGALGGGLLGDTIAPGGSKTLGAVLGGLGGALVGQSIDRDNVRCR